MQKHEFTQAERFGVWEAHKGACHWCGLPLEFRDVTIDHLLPETLDAAGLAKAVADYGLHRDFLLNDFGNWVPAHASCNASKGARLYPVSPAMIKALDDARRRGERARATAARLDRDRSKARVLAIVDQANSRGVVTRDDVLALFSVAGAAPTSGPVDTSVAEYKVSSAVSVFRSGFDKFAFSDSGIMVTYPGGPTFRPPSSCPNCGAVDQWQGNVCGKCNWAIIAY